MRKLMNVAVLNVCLLATLSACQRTVQPTATEQTPAAAHDGERYGIDPRASRVYVHVYRAGALARLGHNHVISTQALQGSVWLQPTIQRSSFDITVPVTALIVDEETARRTAGADFAAPINAADREATQRNMLREEVLDAARFPLVRVSSVRIDGALPQLEIVARVTVRDVAREMRIPTTVQIDRETVTARGAFDILQTDFGIKPFSVALGALTVQDQLHIRFELTATRSLSTTAPPDA